MTPLRIVPAGLDRLDELVEFWIRLRQHQSSVADPVERIRLLSDDASGEIVRDMYREWLSGKGSAFVAELDGRPVGFVVGFYDEPTSCGTRADRAHRQLLCSPGGPWARRRAVAGGPGLSGTARSKSHVATNQLARRFYEREGFTTIFVQMLRHLPPDESTQPGSREALRARR
jgi:hypothetical protein